MKRFAAPSLLACTTLVACAALHSQQVPGATQLPDHPYAIKKTWVIGGAGNWDYLTADPTARRLFIAHSAQVQVVDIDAGALSGQVTGLREARDIALDDTGEFGYISDGADNQVKVFDRRSLKVVAAIPTGPGPSALVFEPLSKLLFAFCTTPVARPAQGTQPARESEVRTSVTVIDADSRTPLAEILMPGRLGFAQTDSNGQVFVNIVNRDQIARIDAQSLASNLRAHPPAKPISTSAAKPEVHTQVFDWSRESHLPNSAQNLMSFFSLGADCNDPRALAIDGKHGRLFAACNNMKMVILNSTSGDVVTSLNTGPGTDAVAYDPDHSMIYVSNGGAQGSLTIIHQNESDTYAVVQVLPTRQRARTLAVDPSTGEVFLVTDLMGVNLTQPGTIGSLKPSPANGSFQVLVVSN
jgi:DNA-binding beta-propeller fold protein YncE